MKKRYMFSTLILFSSIALAGDLSVITCNGTMNGKRWCDNQNGTVTDMTTGLVWLQKADWGGLHAFACPEGVWFCDTIFDRVKLLKSGYRGANLSDGSVEGDWRVPTFSELQKIDRDPEKILPTKMRAFSGVQKIIGYWSSTTFPDENSKAWFMTFDRWPGFYPKTFRNYLWPVRDGQ
ncbi:Fibronectin, type III [Beggiatoa sp. PS]|nr:Fibronectin, type III [Beggiatoa sp. PS]